MLIFHFSRFCKPYPLRKLAHQRATDPNSIIFTSHTFTFTEVKINDTDFGEGKRASIRRIFPYLLQNHTPCGHQMPNLQESEEDFLPL